MIRNDREYRNMVLEIADEIRAEETEEKDERMIVEGYASTFNEPYVLFSDEEMILEEQIDEKAFENCDMEDVIMQYNHEGRVFARKTNGSLDVTTDDKGLFISADLSGTELGRQLYEEIKGGYTNKMSFGFKVSGDAWKEEKGEDGRDHILRTITDIEKLYDVSAVSIPANDGTSISVRSIVDGVIDKRTAERLEEHKAEIERRRVEIRARAILGGKN